MSSSVKSPAQTHYANALKSLKTGNLIQAETFLAECIGQDETFFSAWLQLGLVWTKMGRTSDAIDAFRMASALDEKNVDALHNLGLALVKNGSDEEGLDFMSKACLLSDDPAMAITLGDMHNKLMDYKKSSFFFLKAYQKDKRNAPLIKKLAIALFLAGDTPRAVHLMAGLVLRFPNDAGYKTLYSELTNKWADVTFDADTKKVIELCLNEDSLRHRNIAPAWSALFLTDPFFEPLRSFPTTPAETRDNKALAAALKSPFLCLGLRRIIIANAPAEHIFTALRNHFLTDWKNHATWQQGSLDFLCSMAVQCWYNDFIFFETLDEKTNLKALLEHIDKTLLSAAQKIDDNTAMLLALTSCYQPLYETYKGENTPQFSAATTKVIAPLIEAQLENPRAETALIPTIKSFTEIEDTTSKAVQKMYENRPYPRWTSVNATKTSDALLNISNNIEILVAGCGTGQEPCLYAATLPGAKITAIDLSRSSIAYGMRMAKKLGYLPRINFLHGDLMKVAELGKKFDYVVSSGVLHHLKDPEKGLSAILSTLKPEGRMSISLYSKWARDIILDPASEYIVQKGYSSSLDDIRRFRQDVMKMSPDDPKTFCTRAGDFFNLSECNDLLFHVQEHRYTFPLIKDMAARHGLTPYFTSLSPAKKLLFAEMFPDGKLSDLDLMAKFEEKNPDFFAEMYKVYFHRNGDTSTHPLDQLVYLGVL